jgi:hypothetical protein
MIKKISALAAATAVALQMTAVPAMASAAQSAATGTSASEEASAKTYTYKLSQINTAINIPQDFITFTRQVTSADPNLSKVGASAEQLRTLMESSNTYLEAMPTDMSYEIVVSGTATEDKSFSEMSDAELAEYVAQCITSYSEAEDDSLFTISTYETGAYTYIVADFKTTTDTVVYSRSYFTVAEGMAVTIAVQTKLPGKGDPNDTTTYEFDDDVAAQLKSIVDSASYSPMKVGITDSSWFNEITGYIFGIIVTIGGLGLILFLLIQSTKKPRHDS